MNALNESEEIKVKKKVFTESTYLNENEKLYLGRKAEVKRDVEDTDLHKGDIVTIDSVEVDIDGWDSDYVNVTREDDLNLKIGGEFTGKDAIEQAVNAANNIHHSLMKNIYIGYNVPEIKMTQL